MMIAASVAETQVEQTKQTIAGDVPTDEWGRPHTECLVCGSEFWAERDHEKMGICDECARKAGASYLLAHTGEHHHILNPDGYARAHVRRGYRKEPIKQGIRMRVFERDNYKCVKCGSQSNLQADHVIPERKGGPTTLENLQTLCARCNRSKGARA